MAFQVSPGVLVKEIDLTNIVPAVSTSIGAIAGKYNKGPVGEVTAISSEQELVKVFGTPDSDNFETWFTGASFLQYGNALRVVRAEMAGMKNAAATSSAAELIKNETDYEDNVLNHGTATTQDYAGKQALGEFVARSPGTEGNSIGVSICATADAFEKTYSSGAGVVDGAHTAGDTTINVSASGGSVGDGGAKYNDGDIIHFGEADGTEYEIVSRSGDTLTIRQLDNPNGGGLKSDIADGTGVRRRWKFYDQVDAAPGTSTWADSKNITADEIHVVVFDTTGEISGSKYGTAGGRVGSVLEVFPFVSQAFDAKTPQGGTNYYVNVMNNGSGYVFWTQHHADLTEAGKTASQIAAGDSTFTVTGADNLGVKQITLGGGSDGTADAPTVGELDTAYQFFADSATIDINLVMAGSSPASTGGATHATNVIDLVEARKDCIAFISPRREDVVSVPSSITQTAQVKAFFDGLSSSSYAVFDSGYKYIYDRYNDVFRYIPLNGDIAGVCANTDQVADAWFSPAGLNRGQIRGAVKLAFNPNKAQRDILYPARINPVISEAGQGTFLFGDKTALARPSAFDRINVRRLFLVLEKAIANAAKFQLFEFNDDFTRAQFKNLIEPFLRDVQGRRGITDFKVICDETNNTGEVIDRNEVIGDIFIKPARSINFITLNFVAVRTGVEFSEIAG